MNCNASGSSGFVFTVYNLELNMKNMNSNTIKVLVLNWIVSKQTELSINGVTVES